MSSTNKVHRAHAERMPDKFVASKIAISAIAMLWAGSLPCTLNAQASSPSQTAPATSVGVNLNITPKRLTFDRNTRSASVYIFNQGTTAATFDISLADRGMLPTGDIKETAELEKTLEGQAVLAKLSSAKPMVRVTPRRATLAPGKGQTIRILITQPAAPTASEYRTHLTVTTLPPRDVGVTAEQAASTKSNQLSFRIQTVFGLSIPLIVRPAPVQVQAEIANPRMIYMDVSRDGVAPPTRTPVVTFDLKRSGNGSLFGNIEVRGAPGSKEPIGLARGVGVYPEIDSRSVRIPLTRAPKAGEQLSITFTDDDLKPGSVAARSTLTAA